MVGDAADPETAALQAPAQPLELFRVDSQPRRAVSLWCVLFLVDNLVAGCQMHVLDRRAFRPVEAGVALIKAYRDADSTQFAWRQPPYEYEHTKMPIDILAGSDALRHQIESDTPTRDIAASWEPAVREFMQVRAKYLLYE